MRVRWRNQKDLIDMSMFNGFETVFFWTKWRVPHLKDRLSVWVYIMGLLLYLRHLEMASYYRKRVRTILIEN